MILKSTTLKDSSVILTPAEASSTQERQAIDPVTGLKLVGGSQTLYLQLLGHFTEQLENDYRPLIAQLEALNDQSTAEDFLSAQKIAHNLKGVASNLSLPPIARRATQLDGLLKKQQIPDADFIQAYQQELDQLAEEIAAYLQENSQPPPSKNPAESKATINKQRQVLKQLQAAVDQHEFIDEDWLDELGKIFEGSEHQPLWQALVSALDDFDFEKAQQVLQRLVERTR